MKILKKSKIKAFPMKVKCVNCRSILLADYDDLKWESDSWGNHYHRIKCPVCGKKTFLTIKQEDLLEEYNTSKNIENRCKK